MANNSKTELKKVGEINQSDSGLDILRDSSVLSNAEFKIVAALLNDSSVGDNVFSKLDTKDFFVNQCRILFKIMRNLYHQAKEFDYLVIADIIESENVYKIVFPNDTVAFLLEIYNLHTSTVNVDYYVEIVKNASIVRSLNDFGKKLHTYPFNILSFNDQLIELQRKFNDIIDSKTSENIQKLATAVDSFEHKFMNCLKGNNVSGVSSGFKKVDNLTGGWQCGDFIVIAARPGKGKTAFALNLAMNAVLQCGRDEIVVIFSLEMGMDQIIQRLISIDCGVSFVLNNSRFLDSSQLSMISDSIARLKTVQIYIEDKNDLNVLEIHNQLKKLISTGKKIRLVIIDYLQLIKPMHLFQSSNRQEEVSFISRSLKLIARSIDVPVIACAQLSRRIEERRGKDAAPQLSDLRESGAIEQDADIVSFLYNENVDNENNDSISENVIECTWFLAKHRNGPTGRVIFNFFRSSSKFSLL